VHLVGFLFIVVIADAWNHEPEITMILHGRFEIFHGIKNFMYFLHKFLQNPIWETLLQAVNPLSLWNR
jgi:hypothetical protein